jgi:hypothetical protein
MGPGSRLLVIERLLGARATDEPSTVWLDLHMLCVTGGQERSIEDYRNLLEQSGFVLMRSIPATCGFAVMEATVK